jgi:hypothetical protein
MKSLSLVQLKCLLTDLCIIVPLLFYLCISLEDLRDVQVHYYGSHSTSTDQFDFIELKEFKTLDTLLETIEKISCKNRSPVIELIEKDVFKYINLVGVCPYPNTFRPRYHNSLTFIDEQCRIGPTKSRKDLQFILDQFINNPQKRMDYSASPRKALIYIGYKEKSVEDLPAFLDRLTDAADKIGVSKYLHITLSDKIFPPLPPPPPPAAPNK